MFSLYPGNKLSQIHRGLLLYYYDNNALKLSTYMCHTAGKRKLLPQMCRAWIATRATGSMCVAV